VNAAELARRVAVFGLPSDRGSLAEAGGLSTPLDATQWAALLGIVRRQRLAGFLMDAVVSGALPVSQVQREETQELHLRWCVATLRLERALLALAQDLNARGIDFLVLKGSAAAHLVYSDPALRMFGDNDVLIRSRQFERALAILLELGYRRKVAAASSAFDRRFGKGVTLEGRAGDELDAHRNLVFGTFGFAIDLDELFDSSVTFELAGQQLRALGPETRLLHACYHAALGDPEPRLSSIRDVAEILVAGPHDPERVITLAREWQAEAVVARALTLCRQYLGATVAGAVVDAFEGHRPTARERRAVASYTGSNRSFAAKVIASLPYIDSHGERIAFLRATAARSVAVTRSGSRHAGLARIRHRIRSLFAGRNA
jgi:hypothetical protein